MKTLLTIAMALLLTACFSEDMKAGRNDSANDAIKISSLISTGDSKSDNI